MYAVRTLSVDATRTGYILSLLPNAGIIWRMTTLPLDTILRGDSLSVLATLPDRSVDLVFADPPYYLQLQQPLRRPNNSEVDAVDDAWDQFDDFAAYDAFTRRWLSECRRVLKDTGALWVIGSYHNIYRVGAALQDIGYWIINDTLWLKVNPMPNFRGVRFTNAHETLIWAKKSREQKKYTFNYHGLKAFNDGLQMRSDWEIPLCTGAERLTDAEGRKIHSTQKPEALLYRVLLATSNPGDIVLDPFFGTGTTGAVAKKLRRHYIGIERDPVYIEAAERRLAAISAPDADDEALGRVFSPRTQKRVKFSALLERGLLHPGQTLVLDAKPDQVATVLADGRLRTPDGQRGSIHQLGAALTNAPSCNGWDHWYYDDGGTLRPINDLREQIRASDAVS